MDRRKLEARYSGGAYEVVQGGDGGGLGQGNDVVMERWGWSGNIKR